MNKPIKSLILFIILLSISLSVVSCTNKTSKEETDFDSETNESKHDLDNGIMFFNRFSSVGEPPFSFPDATESLNGYYRFSYTDVPRGYYDSFLSGLKTAGFSLYSMKYTDFLFHDDCMILSQYIEDDGLFSVSWYQKSPDAPQNGISYEKAAALLMPDRENSLSKIPVHPIDITPEGFFERTGGQIFAVPYYSYDGFRNSGQESLMFEDNEWYSCTVYYVNGTDSFVTSMERVAVCDVDGDGSDDVLLLSYGPTSGLFTFDVMCVTNHGVYDTIFNTNFYNLSFFDQNGKIVMEGIGNDLIPHYFDVLLEESGEETIVMLYENGKRLQIWGTPNTRNYPVMPET